MKRLAEFLRSVIPQDPVQLLFLAGTVCLVIAPRLRWWPVGVEIFPEHAAHWLNRQLGPVRGLILFPSYFAGIAAYFIAFWPGPRPVRRILSCIYLPALPMLAVLCWSFLDIAGPYRSVLEPAGSRINWTQFPFLRLPGLQFCLAGLLLIGIFTRRLILGRS